MHIKQGLAKLNQRFIRRPGGGAEQSQEHEQPIRRWRCLEGVDQSIIRNRRGLKVSQFSHVRTCGIEHPHDVAKDCFFNDFESKFFCKTSVRDKGSDENMSKVVKMFLAAWTTEKPGHDAIRSSNYLGILRGKTEKQVEETEVRLYSLLGCMVERTARVRTVESKLCLRRELYNYGIHEMVEHIDIVGCISSHSCIVVNAL